MSFWRNQSRRHASGLAKLRKNYGTRKVNVKVEIVVSPTAVVPAMVDYAKKNKVDLIITGTKDGAALAWLNYYLAASHQA